MIIISNVIKAFMLSPSILGALEKVFQADGKDLEEFGSWVADTDIAGL